MPRPHVEQRRSSWSSWLAQFALGALCRLLFLPYLRSVRGLRQIPRQGRRLFVVNHTSLLDTLLLGGIFWAYRRLPILVLGDRAVWHATGLHRFLSAHVGFLIERGALNKERIQELHAFGRSRDDFHLIVFPEGTRGDGRTVQACQPGVYFVAREAKVPIVPVFIENMGLLSSKHGGVHPLQALLSLRVRFGEEIQPQHYLELPRRELAELVRQRIQLLAPDS